MRRLALIILLQTAAGSTLAAQAAAPGPSPSHARAAEELLVLLGLDNLVANTAPMFESLKQQFASTPRTLEVVQEFMGKYLKWEELKPEFIAAYTDTFSEREVRELLAFYKTPIGTKLRTNTPVLGAKVMTIVQSRLQPHTMEMVEAMMKKVPPS